MKRTPRLLALSREHHTALKLARRLAIDPAAEVPAAVAGAVIAERPVLLGHFAEEERDLLPELLRFGEQALADRLLDEHRQMEILSAMHHDPVALERLGVLLAAHVRFEERELFEVLQRHWDVAMEQTPPRA